MWGSAHHHLLRYSVDNDKLLTVFSEFILFQRKYPFGLNTGLLIPIMDSNVEYTQS